MLASMIRAVHFSVSERSLAAVQPTASSSDPDGIWVPGRARTTLYLNRKILWSKEMQLNTNVPIL